ncbi:MAG: glycosyltransferase family 2 protein [Micrococcales bacterium]|nr:glycosyltransferase family 2 protein [Micrococcales bacterium]
MPAIWIVVPALNEAENLADVIPQMVAQLTPHNSGSAVLIVDDGSRDNTASVINDLSTTYGETVQSIRHRANEGKSAALRDGFTYALDRGAQVIVMMDADGQDNATELPSLLAHINAGSDLVTGARTGHRHDPFIKRTTSLLYNGATRLLSHAPGTDFNSGYKAMRADVALDLLPYLYGEMHRYITPIAYWRGFLVDEVNTTHFPRLHGKSKYGPARFWRGFVDLMTIRFLMKYSTQPSHLFTGIGGIGIVAGAAILIYLFIDWIQRNAIGDRPLLLLGVLLFIAGLQLLIFGLLAELVVHNQQRTIATHLHRDM